MSFTLSKPQMDSFFQVESSSKFLEQRHLSSHILILPVKSLDHCNTYGMVSFVANKHSQMVYNILCQAGLTGVCTWQKCTSPMVFSVSGKSPWVVSLARWENGQMLFRMSNKSHGTDWFRTNLSRWSSLCQTHLTRWYLDTESSPNGVLCFPASLSLDSVLDFKQTPPDSVFAVKTNLLG